MISSPLFYHSTLRRFKPIATALALIVCAQSSWSQQQPEIGIAPVSLSNKPYVFDTAEQHKIKVSVIANGLPRPFSLLMLPNGDALVSERGLQLRIIHDATGKKPKLDSKPVPGMPQLETPYRGGGLHDLALHPQFADNHWLYFTYNKPGEAPPEGSNRRRQSAITLMRGRFDGKQVTDVEELFSGEFAGSSGSRIAFGNDDMVYITTGAPVADTAQKLSTAYGKVLRLHDDGSIPADNPFVGKKDANPAIYSYGHRDQLGLTVHPQNGAVLAAEHGPNGGDEVNVILPGRNYGWPIYSFGRNYDGPRISDMPLVEGIEQALVVWLPSIAPTGLTVYTGDKFPAWRGNLFVGSSRRGEVPRTGGLERVVFNDKMEELRRETLLTELHQRVRDVRQGPDGLLYVLTDGDDNAVMRIEPAE